MATSKEILTAVTALGLTIAACGGGELTKKVVGEFLDPGYPTEQEAEEKRGYPKFQTSVPNNNPTVTPTTEPLPLTSVK